MHLVVVSHKLCWQNAASPSGYATDGGFPLQMAAISELFDSTELLVPTSADEVAKGLTPLAGARLSVRPLSSPKGSGLWRKFDMIRWVATNGPAIWRSIGRADAVHAPIPGDVGTIGMLVALVRRKRLFVRHCGNWLAPRTIAEKLWKWTMESFAGGRNVMLATGGSPDPPSARNPNVGWIFSTSLSARSFVDSTPRRLSPDGSLRLAIACRQEERKGTDVVIDALPEIARMFPNVTLDVIGDGSQLSSLKERAGKLGMATRVRFHGKVAQSEVVARLAACDLFCYPTTASEGFPKVVLEAMSAGLPIVTTRVSVLPVLIGTDCGAVLDEASAEQLAGAVCALCTNAASYAEMSRKSISRAREFSIERWRDTIGDTLRASWEVERLDGGAARHISPESV